MNGRRRLFQFKAEHKLTKVYHVAVPQQLWLLASIVVCTSTAKSGLEPIIIQYVQKTVTDNAALVALAYLPSAVVFAFLQSRLGKVSDRVGRRKPVC